MQPFVGQVIAVGFNFPPVGWALCNGQLLSISDYEVLFNLIGTTYGGNGQTNFAVPNLNGRTALSQGPGYTAGQAAGTESVTLTSAQAGSHTHQLNATTAAATAAQPASGLVLAQPAATAPVTAYGAVPGNTTLAPGSIAATGGNQPHENRQPFLVVNYIIATQGIYPSA